VSALQFRALSLMNLGRNVRWFGPDGLESWSLSDWGVAAAGELGEALNVIKKLNRARGGKPGNRESTAELRTRLADELGDTVIYLDLLAQRAGIDLGTAVQRSFDRKSVELGFPERLGSQPGAAA
jgi:NTP pyrophosphatase (non-canonical NTP hydrolase)